MKFYIDLATRRFVKAPTSPLPLQRVFFKRRDIIDVEVVFVDRSAIVPTPLGTTLQTALKRSFSDPQFLAAAANDGTLNLYTIAVEELFPGNTASAAALLEVKYTRPGEETRTATLAAELQNSVILGTEGTPVAVPDLKATLADAETGTDNTKWMTPLRVWDAIRKAATAAVTWANLPGKPSTFPPEEHTHTAAQITDFASAVTAVAPPAGALIISKTYAELKTLKDANQLVPGQWYKITDFQLKWWNQSSNDIRVITSFEIEPLNVFAIKNNDFSPLSYSDLYPKDTIYYGFSDIPWGAPGYGYWNIANSHGWINRRISTELNIDITYDWRHVTFNCCKLDLSSVPQWTSSNTYSRKDLVKYNGKLFISSNSNNLNNAPDATRVDINGAPDDMLNFSWWIAVSPFVESQTYFPTNELNETSFIFCIPKKWFRRLPWSETSNPPMPKYSQFYGKPQQYWNPVLYQESYISIPWDTSTRAQKPTFADGLNTTDSQNSFHSTNIKIEGRGNIFYGSSSSIELGEGSSFNIFYGQNYFINAKTGFQCNKIGYKISTNSFGNNCSFNSFGRESNGNVFGDGCSFNVFGKSCFTNSVQGAFSNNILGYGFSNNSSDLMFFSNFCYMGTLNQFNKFGSAVVGNDFTIQTCDIDGNFFNNEVGLVQCKIGKEFNNNTSNNNTLFYNTINEANSCIFDSNFLNNICNNLLCCNFSNAVLYNELNFIQYLTCGAEFLYNTIKNATRLITPTYFYKNTIDADSFANINADSSLLNASIVRNSFHKRISQNSSGQPRLSYHNAADQLVVTSPTA